MFNQPIAKWDKKFIRDCNKFIQVSKKNLKSYFALNSKCNVSLNKGLDVEFSIEIKITPIEGIVKQ